MPKRTYVFSPGQKAERVARQGWPIAGEHMFLLMANTCSIRKAPVKKIVLE